MYMYLKDVTFYSVYGICKKQHEEIQNYYWTQPNPNITTVVQVSINSLDLLYTGMLSLNLLVYKSKGTYRIS